MKALFPALTPEECHLSTPRFDLTILTQRDADDIWPSVSDPAIAERMSWNAHQSREETLAFLKRIEDDFATGVGITWGIRMGPEFCGIFSIIGILRSHRALRYDRGEVACWCARNMQGRGVMAEAGKRVIDFSFNRLGLNRLVVGHDVENLPSQRMNERFGFKLIGIEHEAFMKNGRWIDTKMYELLKKDFFEG